MYLCYVDEAGCPGALPSSNSNVQPTLVLAGLFVPQVNLTLLTQQYLSLKVYFHPGLRRTKHFLDCARQEIKGSDLRRDIRRSGRNRRRAVFGFIDSVLSLLEDLDVRLIAKIFVKAPGQPFDGVSVYTATMQDICSSFQHFLTREDATGLIVADSRTPALNSRVSHSIFTQKFQVGGDPYDRIVDMPTFGHSENHIPLQIADLICSTILTPVATSAYCDGHINSVHVHPRRDRLIRARYALRIRNLGYRYPMDGWWWGGISVRDEIGRRPAALMWTL